METCKGGHREELVLKSNPKERYQFGLGCGQRDRLRIILPFRVASVLRKRPRVGQLVKRAIWDTLVLK